MIKHMNAVALKGKKYQEIINNLDYIIEEKLKGIRAFVSFYRDGNIITSRGGHDISHRFPHIRDYIILELEGIVFDGELYQPGVEDEIIAGWGNHRTININPNVTQDVKLYTFDIISNNMQIDRKAWLTRAFYHIPSGSPFINLPYTDLTTGTVREKLFDQYLFEGKEGIMLKNKYAKYNPGTRLNNNWYKLKGNETFDVIITGFKDAKQYSIKKGDIELTSTKYAGLIGAFTYGMYIKDYDGFSLVTLGSCSGMSDSVRISMTSNPNYWIDQVVEIEGVEQKASGAIDHPRYKRYRLDKSKEECIWIK